MDGTEAFGFGQNVVVGTNKVTATSKSELKTKLANANADTTGNGTVIQIDGNANAKFDFDGEVLAITGKKIAIRAKSGSKAVLENVQFAISLDTADHILLEDLVFHSDGGSRPNDAITIRATGPAPTPAATTFCNLRISHCTFDGYADIAIDAATLTGRPRLLATIDHCLFFDDRPGQRGARNTEFIRRGAINIASLQPDRGNGDVTIAFNVYIDVWRRLPRIAGGNFAHIYNNLLYRWGYLKNDNDDDAGSNTYRGIEIGGGDLTTDNGQALIEANRFIPWTNRRQDIAREIAFNQGTQVSLGTGTSVNEFDDPAGNAHVPDSPKIPVVPAGSAARFTRAERFTEVGLTEPPVPAAAADFNWKKLVKQEVGSRVLRPDDDVTSGLLNVLKNARS
jgi:pectate lyase